MTRNLPGTLTLSALEALAGPDERRMRHFHALSPEDRVDAIRRAARTGMSDHLLARATGASVEEIRRVLGERRG